MVHRKNRDLKAECVEYQLAAQQWEDKYIEAMKRPVCTGRCASLSALVEELRADLGQASRELIAVTNTLDQCRRERGEALDKLVALESVVRGWRAADPDGGSHMLAKLEEAGGFQLTTEGDISESEAMRAELDDLVKVERDAHSIAGVSEMHTTCNHGVFSHTKNLECPKPIEARDAPIPTMVVDKSDWGKPIDWVDRDDEARQQYCNQNHDFETETRDDLNDSDEFEVNTP